MGGNETKALPNGMIQAGNIDINDRPVVHNADGTVSTEKSFSIGTDKGEVLIPQVVRGRMLSQDEAIKHYKNTGEHLGIFDTPKNANVYANQLHLRQGDYVDALKRIGSLKPKVIIPDVGAAKFWYVDPRAGAPYNPMRLGQGVDRDNDELVKALERIGTMPKGTVPSM